MMNQAIVFPGQGSQSVGMLAELAEQYPDIEATFHSVSEQLGYDLWQLVQQGPADVLNQTVHTQVAMLTADVAIFNVLQSKSTTLPIMMAGHSLGEYAALVCSEAIPLLDAARLVQTRGRLMQETVSEGVGAMAAIVGLDDAQVTSICEQSTTAEEQVTPANFNAIGQVVIAGHAGAVQRAIVLAEKTGARLAKIIPVSVPCHCALLAPAAERFTQALADAPIQRPKTKVISNVDLSTYESADQIRMLLCKQLYSPVRWVETIQKMKQNGVTRILECGPGKVLNGLIKRIDNSIKVGSAADELSHV
jgi:[acyl-carrier-protein] S-malonyltransferase